MIPPSNAPTIRGKSLNPVESQDRVAAQFYDKTQGNVCPCGGDVNDCQCDDNNQECQCGDCPTCRCRSMSERLAKMDEYASLLESQIEQRKAIGQLTKALSAFGEMAGGALVSPPKQVDNDEMMDYMTYLLNDWKQQRADLIDKLKRECPSCNVTRKMFGAKYSCGTCCQHEE